MTNQATSVVGMVYYTCLLKNAVCRCAIMRRGGGKERDLVEVNKYGL
jgi:hypothetical protein